MLFDPWGAFKAKKLLEHISQNNHQNSHMLLKKKTNTRRATPQSSKKTQQRASHAPGLQGERLALAHNGFWDPRFLFKWMYHSDTIWHKSSTMKWHMSPGFTYRLFFQTGRHLFNPNSKKEKTQLTHVSKNNTKPIHSSPESTWTILKK